MPRRRSVNQPSLKSPEKEDGFDIVSEDESPQKLRIQETASSAAEMDGDNEQNSLVKITQLTRPEFSGMRTRGKGRLTRSPKHISEVDESTDHVHHLPRAVAVPVETVYTTLQPPVIIDKSNESSQSGDGKQQSLSLEALCQAAKSELQIISKEKCQEAEVEIIQPVETETKIDDIQLPDHSIIQVASGSDTQNIVFGGQGSGETELYNLEKVTSADGEDTWVLKPSTKKILYQGNETQGISSSIESIDQQSPQIITVPYTTTTSPGVVHYVGQQDMDRQIGRRRKHPAKPGKHICPYCSRGCTKPSVLEKHIRAHTGERPFPCEPCGFSFKTKSNLYKHCKSRAHQMKVASSTSTSSQTSSMDIDEGEEDGGSFDSDTQGLGGSSKAKNVKTTVKSPGTKLILPAMTPPQGNSPVIIGQQGAAPFMLLLKQGQDGTTVIKPAYTIGSPGVTQMSKEATVVTSAIKQQPKFTVTSVASSIARISSPPSSAVIVSPPSSSRVFKTEPKFPTQISSASSFKLGGAGQPVSKLEDLYVKSTVEKLPGNSMKVTIQLPKPESTDTGVKAAAHGLITPIGLPRTPLGKPRIPTVPKLPAPKNLTPDELKERISYLIDTNQAIVNTPMAEPPRPKRFARQRSEILFGTTQDADGIFSDGTHLTVGPLTPKDKFGRAASFDVGQLKKIEMNQSNIDSITGTRDSDLVNVIPLSKVDESVRNIGKDVTVTSSTATHHHHNLPDSFPPPTQGFVVYQDSGDIVLQSSIHDDDDNDEGDNVEVMVNDPEEDNENPLIIINSNADKTANDTSGIIDISDDETVSFQDSLKPIPEPKDLISIGHSSSIEEGIAKQMKSLSQLSHDKQTEETIQISLESSDLNEDGIFSEEGKSFACMECHIIFSNLSDVMTHLVENCPSLHSGTGNQKIDVFKTDGSHSILTVVKKRVMEEPAVVSDSMSLVSVVSNGSGSYTSNKNIAQLSTSESVTVGESSNFDEKIRLKIIEQSPNEISQTISHGSYGNVVLEMVDPTAPLKRGRPKGSRNRPKESSSSTEGGSFSSEVGDIAYVGAWKTPPIGASPFHFPNKNGSNDLSPMPQEVDVIQLPVTEGMFKGYRSATASMRGTPNKPPLRLTIPQLGTTGVNSPPPPFSAGIRPKVSTPVPIKSSPLILSPVKIQPASPVKLLSTPQKADAKKALQSHILMKRSLSVEKVAQDKQRQFSLPGGFNSIDLTTSDIKSTIQSSFTPQTTSKSLKVKDMLRPTRSLEEAPQTKRPRLQRQASVFEAPPEGADNIITVTTKGKEGPSVALTVNNSITMKLPTIDSDSLMLHESYTKEINPSSKDILSPPKCIITITPPPISIEQDVKDILANIIKLANPNEQAESYYDVNLPYNIGKTVLRGSNPTTAPCFKIPTHDNQTLQLVNLPKSIAYKIPGLVESETNVRSSSVDSGSNTEIKETTEDVNKAHFQNSEKSNESEDKCEDGVGMSTEEETTADKKRRLEQDESKSEETMESDEKKQKTEHSDSSVSMDVQLCSSSLTGDLTDLILPLSDGSLLSLEKDNNARLKKEMVLDLENAGKGPQLSIPAHLQDKAKIVMMLLGHSYPVIKPNTHGTLCSITKPQPMYVKQNDNQKISMYSTWRAAPFNPNPEGLTTKQLLKLYTSTRIDNHPYFVSAASDELSKPQVTDSLNWEDKENTSVEPENDVSTESNSPLKSQNRLDIPRRTKSGLVCTVKEFKSKENSSKQVGQKMKQEQFQKREKTPTKSSPSSAEPPVITIQSIPHQVEQESSKETDVLDDRRVYILPKPQVSSEMLSFDGNYEMQNLSLQGSDYILLKPRVTVQQTAQQKRHQLQAHGLKGFKSEENYTYVRGRGRGKYVCQECGIRCKKPSMLRKHLKTHTDMRPYHCKYCMFSFKTKGNLTKHMKSKAHQKKCTELGIFPIPVYVDESCVLTNEQMNAQHSAFTPGDEDQSSEQTVIVDGTIPVLQSATSQFSTMGSSMEDDDDLDDDEDDSLDRGEEVEEEQVSFDNMLVLDTEESVQQQQQQVTLFDSEKNKPEEKYLTVRETESGEPMLLKLSKDKDGNTRTEIVPLTPEHKQRLREGSPRDSVDKEVANSLLDLAQRPQDGETGESKDTSLDSKQDLSASGSSQKSGDRLEGLIGQLVDRTGDQVKVTTEQGTKSHDSSFTVIEHPLLYASSEMKTKDPTNNNQLKLTREGQTSSKSGFVPPSFEDQQALKTEDIPPLVVKFPSSKIEVAQTKQLLHQIIKDYLKPGQKVVLQGVESSNLPPVISDIIPLESRTREPLLEDYSVKVEYTGTGLSSEPVKSSSVMSIPAASSHHQMYSSLSPRIHSPNSQVNNSTVHKSDLTKGRSERDDENNQNSKVTIMQRHTLNDRHFKLQRQKSQDDEMDTSNLQDYLELIQNKQYNDTGKKVVELGVKIKPIPGRVNQSELEKVDGKYVCKICRKCFQEGHLLQKHLQVHAFEQPFKCADCMTSFRTSEQLDRHMSSEAHLAQLNLKRRLGLMSNDDPRPYKCQDCNVAFRIHGHLAKHLRSKLHIMQLENMGKIPMGTAMELEKIGPQMNVLDAESCLEDILSMIKTGVINVDQTSDIIRPQFTSIKDFHSQTFSPVTVMSNALTASKSASFGGYSTGGNTVIFSTVVATPTKNAMSSSSRGNSPLVVNLSAQDREALSASLISPQKTSERVKVEMIKSESLFSQDSQMQHGKASPSLTSAPHKCGICGSRFVQMDLLKEHLVSHAELRPYVCEFCDAGFTAAKSLQAHLLSHASPTKNYACCHCNKIFSEVNDLVKHSQQCTVQQSTNSAMINVKTQVLAQTTGNGNILSPHRSPKLGQISRVRGGSSFSAIAGTSSMSGNSSAPRIEIVKTLHKSASEGGAPPSSNVQVIPVDGNTVQMKEVMQEQPDGSRKAVKVMVINWDSIRGNSQQHHDTVIPSSVQTVSSYNNAILSTATSSDSDHRVSMLSSVVVPSSGSLFDPAIDLDIEN